MSANNYLLIEKIRTGYRVSDVDSDGSGGHFLRDKPYPTLESAIHAANKYMELNEVEYGLRIKL